MTSFPSGVTKVTPEFFIFRARVIGLTANFSATIFKERDEAQSYRAASSGSRFAPDDSDVGKNRL
jgi:hypothetical protein